MSNARASADTFPSKYARASVLVMGADYGETHMGLHIANYYRPDKFDCMSQDQVGPRIRSMRKALGLNQEELAQKLGVDQSTISDIERGAGFSADLLMRLTEHLGGTPSLIMRGFDESVWPFPHVAIERFLALDATQRGYVEGKLASALDEVTNPSTEDLALHRSNIRRKTVPVSKKRAA